MESVAVSAVLIAYNWPKGTDRYRRIQKFVDTFFPKLAEFQKPPRHPKWKEANLAATLPGWTRFEGAEEWLKKKERSSRRPWRSANSSTASCRHGRRRRRAVSTPTDREAAVQGIHAVEQDAPLTTTTSAKESNPIGAVAPADK